MDPEATLTRIRTMCEYINDDAEAGQESPNWNWVADLTEACAAMDDWLSTGGFLPKDWKAAR